MKLTKRVRSPQRFFITICAVSVSGGMGVIMKKIFYVLFICCILSSCSTARKEEQMTQEKMDEGAKYPEVSDELGIKHQLRLGEIDVENTGQKLIEMYFSSDYSQVLDNHYYYMRSDNLGNHIVYRDNKEKVTQFTVKDAYISSFFKSGDLFYALLVSTDEEKTLTNLAYINKETGKVTILQDMSKDIPLIRRDSPILYKGFLFYEDMSALVPNSFTGRLTRLSLNKGLRKEHFSLSCEIENVFPKPLITLIDGKIYYGKQEEKMVTLYSFDLESNKEKEIFCYERKVGLEENEIMLQIDNEYIYCQDFIIPREGGKMKRALKDRAGAVPLSYNDEYIFYIDKKKYLHRIKKDTYKDVMICGEMKVENVECVEDRIYVRSCNEAVDKISDDDSDEIATHYSSKNLFSMDINGENRKRLCREKTFTEGDFG